jgi:hypothetical protein
MYKLGKDPSYIIRIDDNKIIGTNETYQEFKEFLEWQKAGNEPLPAQTQEEINNDIIREQLKQADLAIIRALVEGDQARINAFKKAQSDRRKLLIPPGE